MEKKKQLNLNAPFLSVRRYSSPHGDRSSPGRQYSLRGDRSSPGRQYSLRVDRSSSDCENEYTEEAISKPATVPFQWENSPGRPKSGPVTVSHDEPLITPKLPPGRLSISCEVKPPPGRSRHSSGELLRSKFIPARFSARRSSGELPPGRSRHHRSEELERIKSLREDHANLVESLKDSLYREEDTSDKSRGSDSFSDAFDSLSQSDSSSCKSSRTFSKDPQTRDLMMDRFLPAAKAAVLEIPQYIPRKKEVELMVPQLTPPPVSNVSLFYKLYKDDVESEDEEEEEDEDPAKIISNSCGFLPRLCVNLNNVSGTKYKTPPSTPKVPEVRRLTRNAYSGPLDKRAYDDIYKKQRYYSGVLSQELHKAGNKLINDPKRNSFSSDFYKIDGFSPRLQSRSGGISPYRNERPQSPFRDGAKFLGLPKQTISKPPEKVLHVDSVNNKVAPNISVNNKVTPNLYFDFLKSEKPRDPFSERLTAMKERKVVAVKERKGAAVKPEVPEPSTIKERKVASAKPEVVTDHKPATMKERKVADGEAKEAKATLLMSPLPPPLPKSPSESWLWRTISLRNPFSYSPKQSPKQTSIATKWETMVKSSNINHDHVRYSQELVSHMPRQHKRK